MHKVLLAAVLGVLAMAGARAEEAMIETGFGLREGDGSLSTLKITVKPGVPFQIAVPDEKAEGGGAFALHCGVEIDGKAAWKDGRIAYEYRLRVREPEPKRVTADGEVVPFRTREFLLSGTVPPGRPTKVRLDDSLFAYLTLSAKPS